MREDAFRSWLLSNRSYDGGTINSRVSNCKTVEGSEGDLDEHFEQDRLRGLVEKLTYSKADERQNRPARHQIPINGNVYNGTATLRSAVSLYKQFRENWVEGSTIVSATVNSTRVRNPSAAKSSKGTWPTWDQPGSDDVLALAHTTMPFVRFLSPDIVRAVVEDNEKHRAGWVDALQVRGIDPIPYLWERSSCAFPGVRRYAGSREIAVHRGHAQVHENQSINALALDDNDYPKQLWSFVFRGRQFSKFGPAGYALAHLADHKEHGNRFEQDFEATEGGVASSLFGLYTCPSNTVYTPVSLIKPTDFVGTIRALLVRRAQQLYGPFCQLLPPFLRLPETSTAEWSVSEFKWAEPVGTMKHIQGFLAFRNERLANLIKASDAKLAE